MGKGGAGVKDDDLLKKLADQYVQTTGKIYHHENAAITPTPTPKMDAKMKAVRRRQKWKAHSHIFAGIAATVAAAIIMVVFLPNMLTTNNRTDLNDHFMPAASPADAMPAPQAAAPPMYDLAVVEEAIADEVAQVLPDFGAATGGAGNIYAAGEAAAEADDMEWAFGEHDADTESLYPISSSARQQRITDLTPPQGWQITHTGLYDYETIIHLINEEQNLVIVTITPASEESCFAGFVPIQINHVPAFYQSDSAPFILTYVLDGMQFTLTTTYDYKDLIVLAYYWI